MSVVDELCSIYSESVALAKEIVETGEYERYREVVYPKLSIEVLRWHPVDRTECYGYVDKPGVYSAVLSRPHIMRGYLTQQIERLTSNYECDIRVERSDVRIPLEYIDGLEGISGILAADIPRPSLDDVDDAIIDGEWDAFHGEELPLFHFTPQRFDIACARIRHYTGIAPDTVQRYILFTNYSMHMTEFLDFAREEVEHGKRYQDLVVSGDSVQMPRIDLIGPDHTGLTMINIGVGPSNAKTITDCLAVLRPEAWVMIGHCAGLDGRMRMGDLILGNAYQRGDHILEDHIPLGVPIPAVPEVQKSLESAVKKVYGEDLSLMRTGTVLSTDDRNWEWHTPKKLWEMLRGSTAAACDMESATLAANGYRYRIPYGSLLAVSDLPLHAVPKLPAAAQTFYANSKRAHVMCAVRAMERLASKPERLRTRKLRRTIGEVPFR